MTILTRMTIFSFAMGIFGDGRIQRFLKRPISYRTVSGILVVTVVSTLLFWKAQSMEAQNTSIIILNLSEFKYFDARLDRHLEAAKGLQPLDTSQVLSTLSVLQDLGRNLEENTILQIERGGWVPDSLLAAVGRELNARLMLSRVLIRDRAILVAKVDSLRSVLQDSLSQTKKVSPFMQAQIDSLWKIRLGWTPPLSNANSEIQGLIVVAAQQNSAFKNLRQQKLQLLLDDLIRAYQEEMRKNLAEKDRINGAFYLLSLIALLVVVVLLVRIRR
jgi:hypothetical protein